MPYVNQDVILMADELYLQKKAIYSSGEYIGVDDSGDSFEGIIVFMICELNASYCGKSIP